MAGYGAPPNNKLNDMEASGAPNPPYERAQRAAPTRHMQRAHGHTARAHSASQTRVNAL